MAHVTSDEMDGPELLCQGGAKGVYSSEIGKAGCGRHLSNVRMGRGRKGGLPTMVEMERS